MYDTPSEIAQEALAHASLETDTVVGEAYHGTSKKRCADIMRVGFLKGSSRDSYLGIGTYFYDSNKDAAVRWAKFRHPELEIGIIKARVTLGDCLDFLNGSHVRVIEEVYEKYDENGIEVESGEIIDIIYKIRSFDTVRAVQLDHGRVADLFKDKHRHIIKTACIIICVKQVETISKGEVEYV